MRRTVAPEVRLRHLWLAVICALLTSCATIHRETPPLSPMSRVLRDMPVGASNAPLEPGRRRPERDLSPDDPNKPLVLLAISGGGSRSAYYAACVMEHLSRLPAPGDAHGNLLDEVRIISAISGGGLAAAWYVTHFDQRHQPDFYDRFKKAMAVNLQWRTYGHMAVFPPLALGLVHPSITRTDLLAEEIQRLLGAGPVTFDDLLAMETRPVDPVPTLIVNGTVYNSGQRIAFTNLPASRFPSLVESDGTGVSLGSSDREILRNLVQPLTFEDFGSDIGPFRLARALAASAAYPMVLAPVPLRTFPERATPCAIAQGARAAKILSGRDGEPEACLRPLNTRLLQSEILYVADGGLHENEGLDPLLSMIKTLPRRQPVLLIVIDGTVRMETLKLGPGKIWGPTTVIARMYDIGNLRSLAFYSSVAARFHDPDRLRAVVIRMEGYDPETDRMLHNIPTMFKLSNSHREALETAAFQNVEHMLPNLDKAYQELRGSGKRGSGLKRAAATRSK